MSKSLRELGMEYESAAADIKRVIEKKRSELLNLKNRSCSIEAYELKRELKILYSQQREALEIAGYLKKYYEPHSGRREIFSYK